MAARPVVRPTQIDQIVRIRTIDTLDDAAPTTRIANVILRGGAHIHERHVIGARRGNHGFKR